MSFSFVSRRENLADLTVTICWHLSLDDEVALLPTKEQTDPIAISKAMRRLTKGGRAPSEHLSSPNPSARKRRRTSFGIPLHRRAEGSDDEEEGEVAQHITPAPKRRARTSMSARRASVAFAPATDPKDRRKSKAQVRFHNQSICASCEC